VLLRSREGAIDIRRISDIPAATTWSDYPQFKPAEVEPIRINKQQYLPEAGLKIWTAHGWSPIRRVIRHKTCKKMFRVATESGVVEVTEDHSLMRASKEALKPADARIGDHFLGNSPLGRALAHGCVRY
jgi:hypothetical protein